MTWGRAQSAANSRLMALGSQVKDPSRYGGPAQSMSRASLLAGSSGKPQDALIAARSMTATTKGLRGLYRRQHQILAKGV